MTFLDSFAVTYNHVSSHASIFSLDATGKLKMPAINLHFATLTSKISASPRLRPLIVAGATASGKTSLAAKLAAELDGEIINADSRQIYADLPILTAQPGVLLLGGLPHHLYGHHASLEHYSVGKWLEEVTPVLKSIWDRGRKPIIVGGTGMYLQALIEGIAPIPPIDASFIAEAKELFETKGKEALANWLMDAAPEHSGTVYTQDPQRLIRATSVLLATGRSIIDWQKEPKVKILPMQPELRMVELPRAELYGCINKRVVNMIDEGGVEEVERLLMQNLPEDAPVWRIIGVPELRACLQKELTLDQAIAKMQQHTRNYAKRQLTWFRNQL